MSRPPPPLEIPPDAVSEDALQGIIDDFILREGTDYGVEEVEHSTKVARIRKQLASGHVKIVFEPDTKTVTLMTRQEWTKLTAGLFNDEESPSTDENAP